MVLLSILKNDFQKTKSMIDQTKPAGYRIVPRILDFRDKEIRNMYKIGDQSKKQVENQLRDINEVHAKRITQIGDMLLQHLKQNDKVTLEFLEIGFDKYNTSIKDREIIIDLLKNNSLSQQIFLLAMRLATYLEINLITQTIRDYAEKNDLNSYPFICDQEQLWCITLDKYPINYKILIK